MVLDTVFTLLVMDMVILDTLLLAMAMDTVLARVQRSTSWQADMLGTRVVARCEVDGDCRRR